jgi:CRP/FNR family cyclic AMP-dependent transcriptional regulator
VITLEALHLRGGDARTLERFIAERPEFAFELLAKVIRRARTATLSARQLALNDVYGRLRHCCRAMAQPQPDGTQRVTRAADPPGDGATGWAARARWSAA